MGRPVAFGTVISLPRPRFFVLSALWEGGWLEKPRLEDYAPRKRRPAESLQQALVHCHAALG